MLIFGTTIYHLLGVKVEKFMNTACLNCTVLSIETSPSFVYSSSVATHVRSKRTRKWWYAVPYPSSFHWSTELVHKPWIKKAEDRGILTFCIGSVTTLTASSTKLRRMLNNQCQQAADPTVCVWHHVAHSSKAVF